MPGGYRRNSNSSFYNLGNEGSWWSSTPSGSNAWRRYLGYTEARVHRYTDTKSYGFNVRCVRNFME